jgi:hypothetical protein
MRSIGMLAESSRTPPAGTPPTVSHAVNRGDALFHVARAAPPGHERPTAIPKSRYAPLYDEDEII